MAYITTTSISDGPARIVRNDDGRISIAWGYNNYTVLTVDEVAALVNGLIALMNPVEVAAEEVAA